MENPTLEGLEIEKHGFHDSFLESIKFNFDLSVLEVCVYCDFYEHKMWKIIMSGVLKFEYETLGSGVTQDSSQPVDIYEIYIDKESEETIRWKKRLKELGEREIKVYHIVLASTMHRGLLHDNKDMEGIQIICRNVSIEKA